VAAVRKAGWGYLLRSDRRVMFVVFAVALLARLLPAVLHGGLRTWGTYDDGVYFAGADAMIHGRIPYGQFVLLHPPGVLVALAPFAWLGSITSDGRGLVVARIAFMLIGSVNAVLAARIARRWGSRAALVAGLAYALSATAIYAERTVMLEGLGNLCLLGALVLLGRRKPSLLLVGLVLGLGVSVKIWGIVPLLVVAAWVWWRFGRRGSLAVASGAVLSATVVCPPFLVLSPGSMLRYVVADQLGRPRTGLTIIDRIGFLAGFGKDSFSGVGGAAVAVLLLVLLALAVGVAYLGWQVETARLAVVLGVVLTLMLMVTPSMFLQYGAVLAAPAAVTIGAASTQLDRALFARVPSPWRLSVVVIVLLVLAAPSLTRPNGSRLPMAISDTVAGMDGCVTADDPTLLILADALTPDLERGCRVWVDVSGLAYDRDAVHPVNGQASAPSPDNPEWQQQVMGYLGSGDATMIVRRATALSAESLAQVASWSPLTPPDRVVLQDTR
jgi:alpha-1,2-mannosyltransferase